MSGMKRLYEEIEEVEQEMEELKNQIKEVRANETEDSVRRRKQNRLLIKLGQAANKLKALKEGL